MATLRRTQMLPAMACGSLLFALLGCSVPVTAANAGASTDAPASAVTTSMTPTESASVALVRDYLAAIAAGDTAASWSMLSPESQAFYGTAETYASNVARNGTVTATEAAGFGSASLTEVEGPEGAFTLVSAATADAADAWIVRDNGSGPRIDDAGVPSTGASSYWWGNPDAGPEDRAEPGAYDPSQPVSITFAAADPANGRSTVGSPSTLWAWQGAEPIDATIDAASVSDAQRSFLLSTTPEEAPRAVTVVWQVADDTAEWRSSTVLITG